jgi:hypothetical protein
MYVCGWVGVWVCLLVLVIKNPLQANQKFASLNWQYNPPPPPFHHPSPIPPHPPSSPPSHDTPARYDVHLAYVDSIAEQKRLAEV